MRIKIVTDDVEINDRILNIIQDKIDKGLEKYLPSLNEDIKKATVTIQKRSRWGYKIKFNMWLPKKEHIFAEEEGDDLLETFTRLREDLEKQLKKYREKLKS